MSYKAVQRANRKKYTNIKTEDCPSIKHYRRQVTLKYLHFHNKIQDLKKEVPFNIIINGIHVCTYIADYTYIMDGQFIVEDVKGKISPEYAIKRKLMLAVHGIKISES